MDQLEIKKKKFWRRERRVRSNIMGTPSRPRLTVFRSHKHIYAQVIDDLAGKTLCSANSMNKELPEPIKHGGDKKAAELVGTMLAQRAIMHGIKSVVFDRGGFKYHGRVKALADAARKAGLEF
ncbi:MAG: 50S ribosomal protein L18 [Phycisphaerae bacterium]